MTPQRLKYFALGFAVFCATEGGWLLFRELSGPASRWVMEPNPGIVAALLSHFAASLLFSVALRPGFRGYVTFTAGVVTAIGVTMFLVGPSNLWPIVLVIDCIFLAPALAGGFAVGGLLQRRHRAAA